MPPKSKKEIDYSKFSIPKIKQQLDKRGISYKKSLKKAQLLKLIPFQPINKKPASHQPNILNVASQPSKPKKIKRQKPEEINFFVYFIPLLKLIYPEFDISQDANVYLINLLNNFIIEFTLYVVTILEYGRKKTITSREIQLATRLFFTRDLAQHIISQGVKALNKFESAKDTGLLISPNIVDSKLRKIIPDFNTNNIRIAKDANVYMGAVIECLLLEIFESAGNSARDHKRFTINVADIKHAVKNDKELNFSLCQVINK